MDKLARKRKIKFRSLQLHYIINTIKTHNYSKCKTKKKPQSGQKDPENVRQPDKVRLVLPDCEDVAASPLLVRKEPDLPAWMTKHKSSCNCYPCTHPTVLVFLVKFFSYQVRNGMVQYFENVKSNVN
jgi:hypothetical protein